MNQDDPEPVDKGIEEVNSNYISYPTGIISQTNSLVAKFDSHVVTTKKFRNFSQKSKLKLKNNYLFKFLELTDMMQNTETFVVLGVQTR